jgi:hypothetical protein
MGGFRLLLKIADTRLQQFAKYFLIPGAVSGFCVLWPYVIQWRMASSNVYSTKASSALRDVFNASFLYRWTDDMLNDLGPAPSASGSWQEQVTDLGEYLLLPALFVLVMVGYFLARRTPAGPARAQSAECRIFAGAAIASILLIVFLHLTIHIDYPISRYCLFVIPLFTVGALLAASELHQRLPSNLLRALGVLVAAAIVSDYALSLQTTYFRYNAYDMISRDLYDAIATDARSRNLATVRVGGTWWYEPEINFYRRRYNATWMLEYEIKDRSYWWQTPNSLTPADYDYFVFLPASDPDLAGTHVRTIYQDERRHVTIIAISH